MSALIVDDSAASEPPIPRGFIGLDQMINCSISSLGALCAQLMIMVTATDRCAENGTIRLSDVATDTDKALLEKWLAIAEECATDFEWRPVKDRIETIRQRLNLSMIFYDLRAETNFLLETIQYGLKGQFIYRYPTKKADILLKWKSEWSPR